MDDNAHNQDTVAPFHIAGPFFIAAGGHPPGGARCVNEWISFMAGEAHGAAPACASPALRRYLLRLNDRLPDDQRQRLAPYSLRALGTNNDGRDGERVAMCQAHVLGRLAASLGEIGLHDLQRVQMPGPLAEKAARDLMVECRDAALDVRLRTRDELREAIFVKLKGPAAEAAAAAVVVAAAAAAAADVVADVAAAAAADAAVDAVAVAVAAAAAAAAAVAAADAAAAAAAAEAEDVVAAVKKALDKMYQPRVAAAADQAFALLDRMLPAEPLRAPVPEAREAAKAFAAAGR